jgi:hypothetical protein
MAIRSSGMGGGAGRQRRMITLLNFLSAAVGEEARLGSRRGEMEFHPCVWLYVRLSICFAELAQRRLKILHHHIAREHMLETIFSSHMPMPKRQF